MKPKHTYEVHLTEIHGGGRISRHQTLEAAERRAKSERDEDCDCGCTIIKEVYEF